MGEDTSGCAGPVSAAGVIIPPHGETYIQKQTGVLARLPPGNPEVDTLQAQAPASHPLFLSPIPLPSSPGSIGLMEMPHPPHIHSGEGQLHTHTSMHCMPVLLTSEPLYAQRGESYAGVPQAACHREQESGLLQSYSARPSVAKTERDSEQSVGWEMGWGDQRGHTASPSEPREPPSP